MTLWEWDEMLFLHDDPYTAEVNRTKVRRCFCMNLTAGQPSKKKPPSLSVFFFFCLICCSSQTKRIKKKGNDDSKIREKDLV